MQIQKSVELSNIYKNPSTEDEEDLEQKHTQNSVQVQDSPHNEVDEDLEQDDFDENNKQFRRHFGNSWVCFQMFGEPVITLGPHWPLTLCMIATFGIGSYVLLFVIAPRKHVVYQRMAWAVAILQMVSYIACALKNPGIVTANKPVKNVATLQCLVCKTTHSQGPLYHCEDCDVCVRGYDHHCPWTGKCIAAGNICFFYIFIFMIPVYFVFYMIITVA